MNVDMSTEKILSDLKVLLNDAEELLTATANQAGEKVAAGVGVALGLLRRRS